MLDTDVEGAVANWLHHGSELDEDAWDGLAQHLADLEEVVPRLNSDTGHSYFAHLQRLAEAVWDFENPHGGQPLR